MQKNLQEVLENVQSARCIVGQLLSQAFFHRCYRALLVHYPQPLVAVQQFAADLLLGLESQPSQRLVAEVFVEETLANLPNTSRVGVIPDVLSLDKLSELGSNELAFVMFCRPDVAAA